MCNIIYKISVHFTTLACTKLSLIQSVTVLCYPEKIIYKAHNTMHISQIHSLLKTVQWIAQRLLRDGWMLEGGFIMNVQ